MTAHAATESLHAGRRALLATFLLLVACTAQAGDWTTNFGGRSERTGLSASNGPDVPVLIWNGSAPAEFGLPPFIQGSRVVSSRVGSLSDVVGTTWIVAQDLATGAQLWSTRLPINFSDSWYSGVVGFQGGRVYASRATNGNNSEYLYALDASNGAILWRSQALITEAGAGEGLAFTSTGDPIHGSFHSLVRIDRLTGQTVWSTPRNCPASGGCAAALLGDRVYAWDVLTDTRGLHLVISVFSATTGAKVYSSPTLFQSNFALANQIGPLVGPDATVYAPLDTNTGNALVALRDTGGALAETWRAPMGADAYASFGIGPDGSVYTYSSSHEVLRLDPATGQTRNTSAPIQSDAAFFGPRMAIDANGRVFVANNGTQLGALYAFDADLTSRWSVGVPNIGLGGPAIGGNGLNGNGVLIVCGSERNFQAYFHNATRCAHPSDLDCIPPGPGD